MHWFDFNWFNRYLYEQLFVFRPKTLQIHHIECVSFYRDLVQVLLLFSFQESISQKTVWTVRRMMLRYKLFSPVTQKSRKTSLQICSLLQIVLNLRKKNCDSLRNRKTNWKSEFESKTWNMSNHSKLSKRVRSWLIFTYQRSYFELRNFLSCVIINFTTQWLVVKNSFDFITFNMFVFASSSRQ